MDQSPLTQSEAAKSRRDLEGELSALANGERSLHDAPWYPAQIGDVLTIRYAAGGSVPACEETYEVVADEHARPQSALSHLPGAVRGLRGGVRTRMPRRRPVLRAVDGGRSTQNDDRA